MFSDLATFPPQWNASFIQHYVTRTNEVPGNSKMHKIQLLSPESCLTV